MVGLKVLPFAEMRRAFSTQKRDMKKTGFYIIKDSFFTYVDDPYLKGKLHFILQTCISDFNSARK